MHHTIQLLKLFRSTPKCYSHTCRDNSACAAIPAHYRNANSNRSSATNFTKAEISPYRCLVGKTRSSSHRFSPPRSHFRALPPSPRPARSICCKLHRFPAILLVEPGNCWKAKLQFRGNIEFGFVF